MSNNNMLSPEEVSALVNQISSKSAETSAKLSGTPATLAVPESRATSKQIDPAVYNAFDSILGGKTSVEEVVQAGKERVEVSTGITTAVADTKEESSTETSSAENASGSDNGTNDAPLFIDDIVANIHDHISKTLEAKRRIELMRKQLLAAADAVKNASSMAIDHDKWVMIEIPSESACYYLGSESGNVSKRFDTDVPLDCKVTTELISRLDELALADGGKPNVLKLGLAEWCK